MPAVASFKRIAEGQRENFVEAVSLWGAAPVALLFVEWPEEIESADERSRKRWTVTCHVKVKPAFTSTLGRVSLFQSIKEEPRDWFRLGECDITYPGPGKLTLAAVAHFPDSIAGRSVVEKYQFVFSTPGRSVKFAGDRVEVEPFQRPTREHYLDVHAVVAVAASAGQQIGLFAVPGAGSS